MKQDFLKNYVLIQALDEVNPDYGLLITAAAAGLSYSLMGPVSGVLTGLIGFGVVKARWREQDRIEADIKDGRIAKYFDAMPDKDKSQINKLIAQGKVEDTRSQPVPYRPIEIDPDAPHFLLLAGTREGKSNALNCLLNKAQKVSYVSTKMTDKVPTHWNGYLLQGSERALQLDMLVADWSNRLANHAKNPHLPAEWFVFDEVIQMRSYAKQVDKKLAERLSNLQIEIATQGAAIGCYVAMLAQTKNAGPLGIDLDLLQQNFQIVVPLKNKRRAGISALEKIAGVSLTPQEQLAVKTNDSEYLQLWVNHDEQVFFDRLPEFKGSFKPLIPYPTHSKEADSDIESKVISWLQKNEGEHTVASIKTNVRPLKDEWDKDEVEDLLLTMASDGLIDCDSGRFGVFTKEQ